MRSSVGGLQSDCPNRRVMTATMFNALEEEETNRVLLMKGKGLDRSDDDMDVVNLEDQPLFQVVPDNETLVLRKALHAQASPLEDMNQIVNLFHTCYLVDGRSCSVIVDNDSCTNACSKKMVDTLKLETR